jgi:hypothetical protein
MKEAKPDFGGIGCALAVVLVFGFIAVGFFSELKSIKPGPGAGNGQGAIIFICVLHVAFGLYWLVSEFTPKDK